ncbi:MAG: PQQ-dependent sugar dehydrogenase [Pirellulaceae bacterium]|nr:PQQ-dependent sugar dehydrogenase [Pirellulaceae bacterium]
MKTSTAARLIAFSVVSTASLLVTGSSYADDDVQPIARRVAWTTSRVKGSPEQPLPYTTERVFLKLKFNQCLDIAKAPGGDRFFVAEQGGKIFSFPNDPAVEKADLVADLAKDVDGLRAVYAITFHPDFQSNRYCYVCYLKAANLPDGSHVARFKVRDTNPPTIDPASRTELITWWSGGHNGCCLKFGPDGCLYISTGDGAPANPPDGKKAGQDITNLRSCILRIDVDHSDQGKNYRIPSDNPFVDHDGARGEIWAYGFRNPWRMSFDRKTGDLWVGDVGWELWEMLDRVERGGNYGWAVMEGRQLTNPEWPRGPSPILPPTIDHPHSESSSITDGLTYYGSRLKELHGVHIYGDYDTGKFWGFRWEDGRVLEHRELADTTLRIVGFGEDVNGEFYVLDHPAGTIHRFIPNPVKDESKDFPRKLSATGLFASVGKQTPSPGVIPYSINSEPWADYAVAERFVAVPGDGSITPTAAAYTFPMNSVLVKTLSLDMQHGKAESRRKVETQILHFDGAEWQPYTYRWNDEQTDAELLGASGDETTFEVVDASAAGGTRQQTWRFSGRAECQRCHNKWSGPPLGFNTAQLNKPHDYAGVVAAQLDSPALIRLLNKPVAAKDRPQLADPHDPSADVGSRARSYLHVNCGHCHRMHAGSAVLSYMHHDLTLEKMNMVGARPTQGTFGIHAAQVVSPGDPLRSVLFYRMSKLGGGRMPHIGSTEVDRQGVELMRDWIVQIPREGAKDQPADKVAAALRSQEQSLLKELLATDPPRQATLIKEMLGSTTGALMLLREIDKKALPGSSSTLAVSTASAHQDIRIRDLFERFLPPEKRVKRLGSVVRPEQILALDGDQARGKAVFFATGGVQCKNCHKIQKEGKELGPDLTSIGKKYTAVQLLESILEPTKRIDPKFDTHLVETAEGRLLNGLLIKQTDDEIILKDAQNMEVRIPAEQVEQLVPQAKSLMPELLLRDMTAQQVADLLAYLSSLK